MENFLQESVQSKFYVKWQYDGFIPGGVEMQEWKDCIEYDATIGMYKATLHKQVEYLKPCQVYYFFDEAPLLEMLCQQYRNLFDAHSVTVCLNDDFIIREICVWGRPGDKNQYEQWMYEECRKILPFFIQMLKTKVKN